MVIQADSYADYDAVLAGADDLDRRLGRPGGEGPIRAVVREATAVHQCFANLGDQPFVAFDKWDKLEAASRRLDEALDAAPSAARSDVFRWIGQVGDLYVKAMRLLPRGQFRQAKELLTGASQQVPAIELAVTAALLHHGSDPGTRAG
ncbi:MAG: hypothetical protein U0800_22775 [Isosphaeraceae bacterium]